jgi:hypothetical protein
VLTLLIENQKAIQGTRKPCGLILPRPFVPRRASAGQPERAHGLPEPAARRAGCRDDAQEKAERGQFLLVTFLDEVVKRIDFVMPDLIRHPEHAGLMDSGLRQNNKPRTNSTFCEVIKKSNAEQNTD